MTPLFTYNNTYPTMIHDLNCLCRHKEIRSELVTENDLSDTLLTKTVHQKLFVLTSSYF
jgi:hypothetical protein